MTDVYEQKTHSISRMFTTVGWALGRIRTMKEMFEDRTTTPGLEPISNNWAAGNLEEIENGLREVYQKEMDENRRLDELRRMDVIQGKDRACA